MYLIYLKSGRNKSVIKNSDKSDTSVSLILFTTTH